MYVNNPNASTQSSNITQFGSSNVATGKGASGAGVPRVTMSNDSFVCGTLVTGAQQTINNAATFDYAPNAACCQLIISNTDASGEVYLRDTVATTGSVGILLRPKSVAILDTNATVRVTNNSGASVNINFAELRTP